MKQWYTLYDSLYTYEYKFNVFIVFHRAVDIYHDSNICQDIKISIFIKTAISVKMSNQFTIFICIQTFTY